MKIIKNTIRNIKMKTKIKLNNMINKDMKIIKINLKKQTKNIGKIIKIKLKNIVKIIKIK